MPANLNALFKRINERLEALEAVVHNLRVDIRAVSGSNPSLAGVVDQADVVTSAKGVQQKVGRSKLTLPRKPNAGSGSREGPETSGRDR